MSEPAKSNWRFIPQRIYQASALLLLLACVALTIEAIWRQAWPFNRLLAKLGEAQWWLAAFLTFLILFLGWMIIVLPLRLFSQLPTYREELAAAGAKNFAELYQKQQEKMFLTQTDPLTPDQQAIRSRGLALGGLLLGIITALITVVLFLISKLIWISGLVITILAFALGSWHGVKSLGQSRRS